MSVGADTWITVEGFGRKRISQIIPDDRVLACNGKFYRVLNVVDHGTQTAFELHTHEERRIIVTTDQQLLVRDRFDDEAPWKWKPLQQIDCHRPFSRDAVKLVCHTGQHVKRDQQTMQSHYLAASVLARGERLSDGGWLLYGDKTSPLFDQLIQVASEYGLRIEKTTDETPILHEVPFLDDTPVEGSNMPRLFFTVDSRSLDWMIECLLHHHADGWPWNAGHYIRAKSFISASHIQHILLRAGHSTEIDSGQRWMIGEGPVWRLAIRNPSNHPVSRTRRVSREEEYYDYVSRQRDPREHHCFSLVLEGNRPFVANDMALAGAMTAKQSLEEAA